MVSPSDPPALHEQVWPLEDFPTTAQGFPVFPYPTEAELEREFRRQVHHDWLPATRCPGGVAPFTRAEYEATHE